MRQKVHKRSRVIGTSVAASIALLLGGGGLVIMNADANARNSPAGNSGWQQKRAPQWRAATIRCPELADRLSVVPRQARGEVDRNLARLDSQVADAYRRMRSSRGVSDRRLTNNAILRPLAEQRRATIDRIAASIGRWGERP